MQAQNAYYDRQPYLDLRLDESRRVVTREGMTGAEVDLARSRISWALLNALMQNGSGYSSLSTLRMVWRGFGRTEEPEDGTIHDAISVLRRRLKPLGVKIQNAPEVGWRLEEERSE